MSVRQLRLVDLRVDGGTQPRAELSMERVVEYRDAMKEGAKFPPVTVFYDGYFYWLADGFHRVEAACELEYVKISAEIRQGTQRDAILYSVGANATHGLPRSNADKRRAVERLLNDAEWREWSDREIARVCAVSQPFVTKMRHELYPAASDNGYQMAPHADAHGNDPGDDDPPPEKRKARRKGTTYEQKKRKSPARKEATASEATTVESQPEPEAQAPQPAEVHVRFELSDPEKVVDGAERIIWDAFKAANQDQRETILYQLRQLALMLSNYAKNNPAEAA